MKTHMIHVKNVQFDSAANVWYGTLISTGRKVTLFIGGGKEFPQFAALKGLVPGEINFPQGKMFRLDISENLLTTYKQN